jgi:uncharacterized protein YgiM (DUF1202 family)
MHRSALAVGVIMALALVVSACTFDTGYSVLVYATYTPAESVPLPEYPTPTPEINATPFVATSTATPPPCVGTVTADPRLNVRSGAGAAYAVVGSVGLGASVEVIGSEAGWLEIAAPPGWVSGTWVRLGPGC